MPGDDLGPAADHHPIHVAPYQDVSVSEGHRHRVVVGLVADQGQGTHPASLLLAGVVGNCQQRQQGVQVPLHPLADGLRVASNWASIRSRQRRSRQAFRASKLSKEGMGTRKLRRA